MTTTSKKLLDLHNTPWETQGTERALGLRNWQAAEEPPAENFDHAFYWNHQDLVNVIDAIEAQILPERFTPESISAVGPDSGTASSITMAGGQYIPVIKLGATVDESCQVVSRVRCDGTVTTPSVTKVRIIWGSAGTIAKTTKFAVRYLQAGSGATLAGTMNTVNVTTADSAVSYGRVLTEVDLPVLTQGNTLLLDIQHVGTLDDIVNDVCIFGIEVV